MLDTAASASCGAHARRRCPAARKTIGTTHDIPAPRHANPAIAATGVDRDERERRSRRRRSAPPARTSGDRPEAGHEPVADDAPGGHRQAEKAVKPSAATPGRRAELVAHVDAAPVRRSRPRSAGRRTRARRAATAARGGRTNVGSGAPTRRRRRRQEAPRPQQADVTADAAATSARCTRTSSPAAGGERAERGAGQPAERERGMEAREDRAPVAALHRDAVRVHRSRRASPSPTPRANASAANDREHGASATTPTVRHASANATRVARRLPEARGDARPASGIAMMAPTAMQASARPSSPSDRPSAVADRRDARRPRAEEQAVEGEDRGDRAAGAAGLGHARTTSIPSSR